MATGAGVGCCRCGCCPPGRLISCHRVVGTAPSAVGRSPSSRDGSPGMIRLVRGGAVSWSRVLGRVGRRSWGRPSRRWTGTPCPTSPGSFRCSEWVGEWPGAVGV
jgi:hypothetical protein